MDDKFIYLDYKYNTEQELYQKMISVHNILYDWGLTDNHIQILIFIIRHGYNKNTKKIIIDKLGVTEGSLDAMLSYMRNGKVGKKKIKKVLKLSNKNMNITELCDELKSIVYVVENCLQKRVLLDFKE